MHQGLEAPTASAARAKLRPAPSARKASARSTRASARTGSVATLLPLTRASRWTMLLAAAVVTAACGGSDNTAVSGGAEGAATTAAPAPAPAPVPGAPPAMSAPVGALPAAPDPARVTAVDVASGLDQPWGLAFLPDGRMLVTERPGRIRVVSPDGTLAAPLENVPAVVTGGDGGLLDLALSPNFATDRQVFFAFVEGTANVSQHLALARATFAETRLEDVRIVFRASPSLPSQEQHGARIVFGADGNLWLTVGTRAVNDQAQNLATDLGKIIRITPDGAVPPDNPFVGQPGTKPEIWSYGHRNVQGLTLNPYTGQLWAVEHGPIGGDEVNMILPGRNYGWPRISHGLDYGTLEPIGEATAAPDVEAPRFYWPPLRLEPQPSSYAPSGMAFYTGTAQPGWGRSLFVGALSTSLMRVQFEEDGSISGVEYLLQNLGERIRDVRMGPDGEIYLLTSNPQGRILRVAVQ